MAPCNQWLTQLLVLHAPGLLPWLWRAVTIDLLVTHYYECFTHIKESSDDPPATPSMMLATDTSPSFAPKTKARSQGARCEYCGRKGREG
jgi:hypothetical protein